jgi:hypothetical protein
MATRHFVNLTNGLEWASELPRYEAVRLESTAIEKRDWVRVFRDLDANFLLALARGDDCHFYDCGALRATSKTVSVGVPAVRYLLHKVWIDGWPIYAPDAERQAMKRKLTYFRRFLATDAIRLTGHSRATARDGDVSYYAGLSNQIIQQEK